MSTESVRTVWVTGATSGIGQACVEMLAQQGNRVVALGRRADRLHQLQADLCDHAVHTIACDVQDHEAVAQAFASLPESFAQVDALVNNAGTCFMSDFPEIPADELTRQMEINFHSAFHCCQRAVKAMAGRPGVRKIVNISSNGAYNFDVFDPPHYRASKAAMDTLTKDLARRYARDKIAVNSIAPAMTETPLFNVLTEDVLARAISAMPHGAAMQPDQIAAWVGFLISPAGDVSSGNIIILNQGRDVR